MKWRLLINKIRPGKIKNAKQVCKPGISFCENQPINTVIIKKLDKCRILRYIVDGGNVKKLEDESEKP